MRYCRSRQYRMAETTLKRPDESRVGRCFRFRHTTSTAQDRLGNCPSSVATTGNYTGMSAFGQNRLLVMTRRHAKHSVSEFLHYITSEGVPRTCGTVEQQQTRTQTNKNFVILFPQMIWSFVFVLGPVPIVFFQSYCTGYSSKRRI